MKEKEEQARILLEEEEEERLKEREISRVQREATNKMIQDANKLLEETAKYKTEISDDFKGIIPVVFLLSSIHLKDFHQFRSSLILQI